MFIARRSIKYQAKGKTQQSPHNGSTLGSIWFGLAIATPLGSGKHVPIDRILTEAISLFGV